MAKSPESFLVINTFGIGDVVFSTPLLRNLSASFPSAKIYYLCNRKTAPILATHPLIDEVFVYERDEFAAEQARSFWKGMKKYADFIANIRRKRIDCCIDLSLNTPFGFFALAAGIRHRIGLDFKNRGIFLTKKIKISGFNEKHVADYYLEVLSLLKKQPHRHALEIYADKENRGEAERFCLKHGIDQNTVIGIAPCGGAAFGKDAHVKRWPQDKYAELIDRLIQELNATIFIFAGPEEKKDVDAVLRMARNGERCCEFTSATLPFTVALVEKCSLFIGNDTGPLRFADALNKRTVAIFGPIDERVYGLYPPDPERKIEIKKDMPCRPCYRNFRLPSCTEGRACLTGISVEEVFRAAKRLLDSR